MLASLRVHYPARNVGRLVNQGKYHGADAAAADGGLKLAVQLLHCAGGVKTLSQQDDAVEEEERSDPINHIL